jgi:hypothetical protein
MSELINAEPCCRYTQMTSANEVIWLPICDNDWVDPSMRN